MLEGAAASSGGSSGGSGSSIFADSSVGGTVELSESSHPTALAAAQRINADRIDILVDLNGYTRHHRAAVLALQPAPLQVTFLGYPSSANAPSYLQLIVADRAVAPPQLRASFGEHMLYMPRTYFVNDYVHRYPQVRPGRWRGGAALSAADGDDAGGDDGGGGGTSGGGGIGGSEVISNADLDGLARVATSASGAGGHGDVTRRVLAQLAAASTERVPRRQGQRFILGNFNSLYVPSLFCLPALNCSP
jgi:hypothetical protein